jgi:hypothetical protein
MALPDSLPHPIDIGVPVPDTAAAGTNALTFTLADAADPSIADTCDALLSGPADPTVPLAFAREVFVGRGALSVSFTLPADGPARVGAFDLKGRRVVDREVSGAGEHVLELAAPGILRSGIYFLRLTQDGAHANARAILVSGP